MIPPLPFTCFQCPCGSEDGYATFSVTMPPIERGILARYESPETETTVECRDCGNQWRMEFTPGEQR